ncbi:hypothetical protein BBK36DRAFT_1184270 [Trichoderma citrinoviride]|uniref:Zn(2)-C6 fungal-type domain-containing protein n=1 Tax=Trichoderma citrinoviride TaxID=58853 RepID=A0A2T4AZM4_9HYPO|nr:hypothetical protein BBK36DRAFT_1184270 [Trichoderma citrinoviride]PTB62516.1 hypothetical protein BBK36DRAFT_1184270 [Trichoderma citrinoviride]
MPPRKRSPGDPESARRSDRATSEAKRRRVSLACDACRTAREKCDGDRPRCGRCVSQNRSCSYTPTSKKRGIQSGYLRAIELSLAWLLESVPDCEEALYQLLVKDGGKDGLSVLVGKGGSSSRLQKQWSNCRVHQEIETLLCQGGSQRADSSVAGNTDSDADTMEESINETRQRLGEVHTNTTANLDSCSSSKESGRVQGRALRLPSNYRHLLDIYFAYTHCWFPILDRDYILASAATCDSLSPTVYGYTSGKDITPSSLAILWSALAVAALQDAHSSAPSMNDEITSPAEILAVARSLVPQEEDQLDISGIQALLLHAIILVGRENVLGASVIAGKAARLISYMRSSKASQTHSELQKSTLERLAAACNVVEALTSICIGQPSHLSDIESLRIFERQNGLDSFCPAYGFGKLLSNPEPPCPQAAHSLGALDQLNRFAQILSSHAAGKLRKGFSVKAVTVGDLVSSLDPQFGFCNSVIAGEATPMLPSAFLVQAMFLATTVELVPGQRSSLISNFLEVVESSIANFGACGTPPITVALFLLVQQKGAMGEMRTSETKRWNSALNTIKAVWLQDETAKRAAIQPAGRDSQAAESHADVVDYDAILEELGNIDYAESIGIDPQFMMNLGFAPGCTLEEMFHVDSGIA